MAEEYTLNPKPSLAKSHANRASALQQIGKYDMAIVYYQAQDSARKPLQFRIEPYAETAIVYSDSGAHHAVQD